MKRFDLIHINEIIEYNKIECDRRNESCNVKLQLLHEIIEKVNELADIPDTQKRVLVQASTLAGLIVFEQPFNNANKSTATVTMIDFLHSNGFELELKDSHKQQELLEILEQIMYLFEGESHKGIVRIREFLEKYIQ
ncbi:MAG: hypothetical protein HZC29_01760 [Thaumarchaeota archaeon]|nr:hypothetical protein [Nitrososphaerota archaeon]